MTSYDFSSCHETSASERSQPVVWGLVMSSTIVGGVCQFQGQAIMKTATPKYKRIQERQSSSLSNFLVEEIREKVNESEETLMPTITESVIVCKVRHQYNFFGPWYLNEE